MPVSKYKKTPIADAGKRGKWISIKKRSQEERL